MDTCQTNSWEYLQQAIDAEIKSLEESILSLKHRRNALAPISSLPTEVFGTILSILRVPVAPSPLTPPTPSENLDNLPWLRLSHVCHHWREIALNQPLFWNHIRFNDISPAGAAGMLARAKTAPLHLEARHIGHWNDAKFSAFQKAIRIHTFHISHLDISAYFPRVSDIVKGLVSPAPILEYLSLVCAGFPDDVLSESSRVCIPDALFGGITPRLSCLKLRTCDISWKSPFLIGLRYLEIDYPFANSRPSLSVWLDALNKMPQLQTLSLHMASPVALSAPLPSSTRRTIPLPSLSVFDFTASARDCVLALAHLILPPLTRLCIASLSDLQDGSDVQEILPYFSQHARGFQNTQTMVVRSDDGISTTMFAWSDASSPKEIPFLEEIPLAPLAFSFRAQDWSPETYTAVFDATLAALPLENLLSLTLQHRMNHFSKQVWLHHTQRWSLIQLLCLSCSAARGFVEMLEEDNGECENPLLPSLITLVLISVQLSARRTLSLCDVLMKRVEQGVPLEALNLKTCFATDHAVRLLSEIVVDVLGPMETFSAWEDEARGAFIRGDNDEHDPLADIGDAWDMDDDY